MLTKNIFFKNFSSKNTNNKILKIFKKIKNEDNEVLKSLGKNYKNSFNKKIINKYKKISQVSLVGMGGSILGARSIYNFLKHKIKKNFVFNDEFVLNKLSPKKNNKILNIIISKSGNTLETISNSNILINNKQNNIFITENKESYLMTLAKKLKADIVHHNNFIGGRYSVLSEVGMLPADLMGLNVQKFKRYNDLIKNKQFINSLVTNVHNMLFLINKKKFNSVILNYDKRSNDLFYWYQQLVAESLGKKGKGFFPVISNAPKDHHSLLQLYLDERIDSLSQINIITLLHRCSKYNIDILEIVSSDLVGSRYACVIDSEATICDDKQIVIYAWYDNELGYCIQLLRVIKSLAGIKYKRLPYFL